MWIIVRTSTYGRKSQVTYWNGFYFGMVRSLAKLYNTEEEADQKANQLGDGAYTIPA